MQVKASSGSSWQFGDVRRFFDISLKGKFQVVGRPKRCPVQRLVVVFVATEPDGNDRFYILTWNRLRNFLRNGHRAYLAKHGGQRPKKWDSFHGAILESALSPHLSKWDVIKKCLSQ